jgi:hypothetical protein
MTTFKYPLELSDAESITLIAALDLLKDKCEKKTANKPCAPYSAWLCSIASITNQLNANAQQVSGEMAVLHPEIPTTETGMYGGARNCLDKGRKDHRHDPVS